MHRETEIKVVDILGASHITSADDATSLIEAIRGYKIVTLDFSGVEDATGEFVHQLFVVFPDSHPEVMVSAINVSETLEERISEALSCK